MRSEFSPSFFGPLYPTLQAIKAAFDPGNQLNPGKIAAPGEGALLTVDGVPMKGQFDRTIPPEVRAGFDEALHCNGNGACYNWDPDDADVPVLEGHARAAAFAQGPRPADPGMAAAAGGARLRSGRGEPAPAPHRRVAHACRPASATRWARRRGEPDFSHEVKEALDGCLACKSCTGQCPIKVDVPDLPLEVLRALLRALPAPAAGTTWSARSSISSRSLARMPGMANALAGGGPGRAVLRAVGLVDTPTLSGVNIAHAIAARGVELATPSALRALDETERARSVVIVQDAFTSYYETPLLLDLLDLVQALGFRPWLAPYRPNGKALHVHGFLGAFERLAATNAAMLQDSGCHRRGARRARPVDDPDLSLGICRRPGREPLAESAARAGMARPAPRRAADGGRRAAYRLLPHCTERTTALAAVRDWSTVFAAFGLRLTILPSGCCGMAGTWGHEAEHRATSEHIYSLSWAQYVTGAGRSRMLLADGYSCRSQAKLH